MKTTMDKERLTITLPLLRKPRPSKSGKSMLVATTRGVRKASFTIEGKPVSVIVSVFIKNASATHKETEQHDKPKTKVRRGWNK